MRLIIFLLIGIVLGRIVAQGFNEYEYDNIAKEQYPLKWYNFYIVKHWEENFTDEVGERINFCVKRAFKNYVLKYEIILASRLNKNFNSIYHKLVQ